MLVNKIFQKIKAKFEIKSFGIKKFSSSDAAVVLVLIAVIIVSTILSPNFLSYNNIINIFRRASSVGLLSLGMSYVIITGGIDLSVAGQAVLVGTSGAILMVQGLSLWPALLIMLLIGCILGAINGFFISRLSFPPFIITLAIMNITRGLALYLTQGRTIFNLPVGLGFFGLSYFLGIPIPIWIMIIAFILGHIGLKYTSFGRGVYAVGDNENAAWLSGLNSNKIIFWVYVLQGLLAAIASIVLISRLGSATAAMAKGMELDAIASVVIGGTSLMGGEGNVLGTFVGVLIITIITNIMNLIGFSPFLQDTAKGIVIILAVLLDIWRKGYLGNIKR